MSMTDPSSATPAPAGCKVAFLTRHSWPWLRQTEDGSGRHLDMEISLAPSAGDEWIVVYDDIAGPIETRVPPERRLLFVTEPPGQKRYSPRFANQFGILVSPYLVDGFRGLWIQSHPAINWFYGVSLTRGEATARLASLAELRAMPVPEGKRNRISVICSSKAKLPRQQERLRLIERLKREFPDSLDVFGQGFKPIADKADAIATYRYHLALENNEIAHFWTEKLADPYLGYSLPVYSGCRNVTDYFPARSLVQLPEITDHDAIVDAIGALLRDDPWPEHLDAIRTARSELIERQNLFSLVDRLTKSQTEASANLSAQRYTVCPSSEFDGFVRKLRRSMRQLRWS